MTFDEALLKVTNIFTDANGVHTHAKEQFKTLLSEAGVGQKERGAAIVQLELAFQDRVLGQMIPMALEVATFDIKVQEAQAKAKEAEAKRALEEERVRLVTRQIKGYDDAIYKAALSYRSELASNAIQVHSDKMQDTLDAFVQAVANFELRGA